MAMKLSQSDSHNGRKVVERFSIRDWSVRHHGPRKLKFATKQLVTPLRDLKIAITGSISLLIIIFQISPEKIAGILAHKPSSILL